MAKNDQILLDQIVEEQRLARTPNSSKSEFFEYYVAEQVLKDYDLSDEELEYGLVGNNQDGGIDAIYTFANGELVQDDFDHKSLKKGVVIEVIIIQSKMGPTFDEATINKLNAVTRYLFSLSQSLDEFKTAYNDGVRLGVGNFRQLYTAIASRFPALHFHYVYASRGDSENVHPNVRRKTEDLRDALNELFPNAQYKFSFLGASDLLSLARRQPATSFQMQFTESLTGRDGYIALVKLRDFVSFIRTENGRLDGCAVAIVRFTSTDYPYCPCGCNRCALVLHDHVVPDRPHIAARQA